MPNTGKWLISHSIYILWNIILSLKLGSWRLLNDGEFLMTYIKWKRIQNCAYVGMSDTHTIKYMHARAHMHAHAHTQIKKKIKKMPK